MTSPQDLEYRQVCPYDAMGDFSLIEQHVDDRAESRGDAKAQTTE